MFMSSICCVHMHQEHCLSVRCQKSKCEFPHILPLWVKPNLMKHLPFLISLHISHSNCPAVHDSLHVGGAQQHSVLKLACGSVCFSVFFSLQYTSYSQIQTCLCAPGSPGGGLVRARSSHSAIVSCLRTFWCLTDTPDFDMTAVSGKWANVRQRFLWLGWLGWWGL